MQRYGIEYKGQEHTPVMVHYHGDYGDLRPDPSEIGDVRFVRPERLKSYLRFKGQLSHALRVLDEFMTAYTAHLRGERRS